jgi:hypothetical protein
MLSKINLACVGALTLLPHLAFAAGATLPTENIEKWCRDTQSAVLLESKAADLRDCVNDERTAFNELRRRWASYPTDVRMACTPPAGAPILYVELQTCLDMQPGGSLYEGAGPRETLKRPRNRHSRRVSRIP